MNIYRFSCPSCQHECHVCGGPGEGFEFVSRTVICRDCKVVDDLSEPRSYEPPSTSDSDDGLFETNSQAEVLLTGDLFSDSSIFSPSELDEIEEMNKALETDARSLDSAKLDETIDPSELFEDWQTPSVDLNECRKQGHKLENWPTPDRGYECPQCGEAMSKGELIANVD